MCGIAGLVGRSDHADAEARVGSMMNTLQRRGPNSFGMKAWDTAVLGHRRLAILDLSDTGHQPMLSSDELHGVVFNGAIYNFRELRSELENLGSIFRSRTDTEVLVHGYRSWGIEGLVSRLRGMFAFGLWDDTLRKLYLVRDRFGVKPLVYSVKNGQLAFASTTRALHASGFAQELDDAAVAEFLEFGYVTDNRSIYQDVSKVPAATILEWSNGKTTTVEYWTPPTVSDDDPITFASALEKTESLFLSAVERRLQADVPLGALLSGGVDSSLVCWALQELGADVTAFTIATPGDVWDETADATATAQQLGINHRVLGISADDAPNVDELSSAYAEPFACASALGMLRVSRAVAREATVLLTGDGGDDVFLGYPEHRHLWLAEKLSRALPESAARGWLALRDSVRRVGPLRRAASFADYTTGGLGAVASAHDGLPFYEERGLLGERLKDSTVAQRTIPWSIASGRQVLAEFLVHDRRGRFVGEYLTKVDGATMYYSLEARSPFLDQELWEFASSLSFDMRLRHGHLKAVLRELARTKLGDRVAKGRKRGFGVPVQRWIAGRWRDQVEEYLRESILESEGIINSEPTLKELEKAARTGTAPKQLWYIFVLESWLRNEKATNKASVDNALVYTHGVPTTSPGVAEFK